MSLVVVVIAVLCGVFAVWSWMKPRYPLPPPLPGALPVIGHAHLLICDRMNLWNFLKRLNICSLEKGGLITFWIGTYSMYVSTDPDDSLLIANTCLNKPYFYNFFKDLFNSNINTANATSWKRIRKLLIPAFNQQVLNTYVNEFNVQARSFASKLASIAGGEPYDIQQDLVNFSLKIASRTSLGLKSQDQILVDNDYAAATTELIDTVVERGQKVWLHLSFLFNMSSLRRKQDNLLKIVKDITEQIFLKRKLELSCPANNKLNEDNESTPDQFKPLLDRLLGLAEKQDAFTDDEIKEQMDTITIATYDTSSSALMYTLLFIGTYQDVQERIVKELKAVLGEEDQNVTKDDLPKLVYLEAVLKESMRLYPPGGVIARITETDIKLKNYTIPAGKTCWLGLYGLNRHPMWGPDADQFRPERWLDPGTLPSHPAAFVTFSVGRRSCLGKLYAMMAMKTFLAHILRRYHITADINNVVSRWDVVMKPLEHHNISIKLRK